MKEGFMRLFFLRPFEGEPDPKDPPKDPPKSFTQEDINRMIAEERRKSQQTTQRVMDELEALKTKADMTQKERDELDGRIEQMKSQFMTKEELAKKEREKLEKQAKEQADSLTKDRDGWKGRFEESTISRTITDSAVKFNAFSPKQLVAILRPNATLQEAISEDGVPTGNFEVKVKFQDNGKTLDLTVEEVVKRMMEMDDYANLFKATGTGGTGNRPVNTKVTGGDIAKLARENPEEYRRLRKEGKIKI